jgi:NAD(P)H-quinone oxidoreductase subunit 5
MSSVLNCLAAIVLGCPILTLLILGFCGLIQRPLPERLVDRLTKFHVAMGLVATLGILGIMIGTSHPMEVLDLGNFVEIGQEHFHFHLEFIFDRLSIPMVLMTFVLVGVIGSFANIYLQGDAGYYRFFVCFSMFLVGLLFAFLAGTIETLFLGWELVGLSSALLIAYFHERTSPVENGLRVWGIYRVADAAFLMAALMMHHWTDQGEFLRMVNDQPWPQGTSHLDPLASLSVGLLLLIAAAGKSGLVPFSGWLPRAMEGPTPSSAVFYGALSIHLGAYLLLRLAPIFADSLVVRVLMFGLGALTAVYAAMTARVQTDIKSALAFSSVCQVGIIVMEIALGFWYLALVHIIGHAFLRSLQLLRAPTLLRDYRTLENAIGGRLANGQPAWIARMANHRQIQWYRFALERGYMDSMIDQALLKPFRKLFKAFERMENDWLRWLEGPSRPRGQDP